MNDKYSLYVKYDKFDEWSLIIVSNLNRLFIELSSLLSNTDKKIYNYKITLNDEIYFVLKDALKDRSLPQSIDEVKSFVLSYDHDAFFDCDSTQDYIDEVDLMEYKTSIPIRQNYTINIHTKKHGLIKALNSRYCDMYGSPLFRVDANQNWMNEIEYVAKMQIVMTPPDF
jgi:hypothetical protein